MAKEQDVKPASPVFKINGVEYAADSLSDKAKSLIRTLRIADRELALIEARLTLVRIARQTIAGNLQAELDAEKAAAQK
jgi:hypothetical protein